ncbi:MAG: DUF2089 family protein [Planctomycetota bacterium]
MANSWLEWLSDEDRAFLKRFLLASGSLKEVARVYGISYPTVRLRLDRLIEKVVLFESMQSVSEFELAVRALHIDGSIDAPTAKKLLQLHRKEVEDRRANPGDDPSGHG